MIQGEVTGIRDGALVGWVADAGDEGRWLEAMAEGDGPFGRTRAEPGTLGRQDFCIPIPAAYRDGRMRFFDVRPLGEDRPLAGGPVVYDGGLFDQLPIVAAAEAVAGDALVVEGEAALEEGDVLSGWAWAPGEPARRLQVEILAGGRLIAAVTADQLRPDLQERGLGDGRYGFRTRLSSILRRGPHDVRVRVAGASRPLRGGTFAAGPFAADGEVDCPGYLDAAEPRAQLLALPLEHLAYDALRMEPERIVPRLINRLRRERLLFSGQDVPPMALLLLPGAEGGWTWNLQSYPGAGEARAAADPSELRRLADGMRFIVLCGPSDLLHPSACAVLARLGEADVVSWNRFCAVAMRAGAEGDVLRRPALDPIGLSHGALADTTIAVSGSVLQRAPEPVLAALLQGRIQPLWLWLSQEGLEWRHHPEALTSRLGEHPFPRREEILADAAIVEAMLQSDALVLERTREDLPYPYVQVPRRRAMLTSVLINYRDGASRTLQCLHSLALQRVSGELEVVLVDNQSTPQAAGEVLEGARQLLGSERVTALEWPHPFNHSAQTNLAARAARGEVVVFCNNDVVLRDPTLIEQLGAWALQPGIGAVGCRLEDAARERGSYGHLNAPPSEDPFRSPLTECRDPWAGRHVHACAGATLALAAMSRDLFFEVGGLDETRFPIGYNDVDLMLRCSASGLTHLYLGHVWAEHARGSSRSGDNEDFQALILNQEHPGAAVRSVKQLERRRIAAPSAATEPAAPLPEHDLAEALEAAIQAREALEAERARLLRKKGPAAILEPE